MKKGILIGLFLIVSGCAGMQPISEADRTLYSVFETPGLTKDQLYSSIKIWIAENFKSSKAVIEYENREEGMLVGNGIIQYPCGGMDCITKADWKVPFTMRVETKDEKFRLTFSNIRIYWPPAYNSTVNMIIPGNDKPVYSQSDMDIIKPKLLLFGNEIVTALGNNRKTASW